MTLKVDGIGTNPIYLNNSYPVTNSFRGDYAQTDSVALDTSQINTTNIAPLEKDTLNISASDKIKTQQKEKGMSTATKVGLTVVGALATTYACVVGHRMLTKPSIEKVAQNFSEIFRRDVSKEEAQKMADRYKEIFRIKEDTEFQKTLFEQLKKDYGLQKTEYGLSVTKLKAGEKGHFTPFGKLIMKDNNGGTTFTFDANGCVAINSKYAKNRKGVFATLVHELNHAKQFETAYRANSDEAINSYINKMEKELDFIKDLKKKGYDLVSELKSPLREFLGNTKPNTLAQGSNEYELGMKYIKNQKNYIPPEQDGKKYMEQIVEKESFDREHKMEDVLYYFLPIWHI